MKRGLAFFVHKAQHPDQQEKRDGPGQDTKNKKVYFRVSPCKTGLKILLILAKGKNIITKTIDVYLGRPARSAPGPTLAQSPPGRAWPGPTP